MNLTTDKLAYTMQGAADACGLSIRTLYTEIQEGRLRAIKARGRRLILKADLEGYLTLRPEGL